MMRLYIVISLYMFVVSCSTEVQRISIENNSAKVDQVRHNVGTTIPNKNRIEQDSEPTHNIKIENLKGCWSSLSGDWLKIDNQKFQTSFNGYLPIDYIVKNDMGSANKIVLELTNRPSAYYFSEILEAEFKSNSEKIVNNSDLLLQFTGYRSEEDFISKKKDLKSTYWVKANCETFPIK